MKNISLKIYIATLLVFPTTSFADVQLGDITILSKPSSPLKANVLISATTSEELQNLKAGIASKTNQLGIGSEKWEKNISYSLKKAGEGSYSLIVESKNPIGKNKLSFVFGIENSDGKITQEYVATYNKSKWVIEEVDNANTSEIASSNEKTDQLKITRQAEVTKPAESSKLSEAASQLDDTGKTDAADKPINPVLAASAGLKISTDLHFVMKFKPGRVTMNKGEKDSLKRLAAATYGMKRVQLKGWAGKQDTVEKQNRMAFSRAYYIKTALLQEGVDANPIKIMRPDLSIPLLGQDSSADSNTPRVVVTLLNTEFKMAENNEQHLYSTPITMEYVVMNESIHPSRLSRRNFAQLPHQAVNVSPL